MHARNLKVHCEKADAISCDSKYHRYIKRLKNRIERRRAKENPECLPTYRRYTGWET